MPIFPEDTDQGPPTGGATTPYAFVVPIVISADDQATLAAPDGKITTATTKTFSGITGNFYVTISKLIPVYP